MRPSVPTPWSRPDLVASWDIILFCDLNGPLVGRYVLRGAIVNRTYGIHKHLPGIYLTIFIQTYIFGPVNYGPP